MGFFLAGTALLPASAANTTSHLISQADLVTPKRLTFCSENWAPYIMEDPEQGLKGPIVDILRNVGQLAGYELTFQHSPPARCNGEFKRGTVDIRLGNSYEDDVRRVGPPIAAWQLSLIIREESPVSYYSNLEEFNDQSIVLPALYPRPAFLDQWLTKQENLILIGYGIDTLERQLLPFRLLVNGRSDVLIEDHAWSQTMIKQNKLPLKVLNPPIGIYPVYMALDPKNRKLIKEFTAAFQKMNPLSADEIYQKATGCTLSELLRPRDKPSEICKLDTQINTTDKNR